MNYIVSINSESILIYSSTNHFQFSLSCIGEGNGNPLQCSCLENPRDGVAWWAAVYGVAQSQTRLQRLSSSSSSSSTSMKSLLSKWVFKGVPHIYTQSCPGDALTPGATFHGFSFLLRLLGYLYFYLH